MKIQVKNSELVFVKSFMKKTLTLNGLMNETNHNGTSATISLDASKYYKVSYPSEVWHSDYYSASYGYFMWVSQGSSIILGKNKSEINLLLPVVHEFIVTGIDSITLGARIDKGYSIDIVVEELEVVAEEKEIVNKTVTQGTGIYDLTFDMQSNIFYYVDIDDRTKVAKIANMLSIGGQNLYLYPQGTFKVYFKLNLNDCYVRSEAGAGDVIGSGNVAFTLYGI